MVRCGRACERHSTASARGNKAGAQGRASPLPGPITGRPAVAASELPVTVLSAADGPSDGQPAGGAGLSIGSGSGGDAVR